jgi:hypothetical protein
MKGDCSKIDQTAKEIKEYLKKGYKIGAIGAESNTGVNSEELETWSITLVKEN